MNSENLPFEPSREDSASTVSTRTVVPSGRLTPSGNTTLPLETLPIQVIPNEDTAIQAIAEDLCYRSAEQPGHSHSPRTRCCHDSGSCDNRTAPENLARSVPALVSRSPFTRDSRNLSSFFFCSSGSASAAASISPSVITTLRLALLS